MWTAKLQDKVVRYGKLTLTIRFDNDADPDESFTQDLVTDSPQADGWVEQFCIDKIKSLDSLNEFSGKLNNQDLKVSRGATDLEAALEAKGVTPKPAEPIPPIGG